MDNRIALACACALMVASCAPSETEQPDVLVRDSNGIQIVENANPAWRDGQGWAIAESARVVIGELEGDENYLLNRVNGAIRMADGRIVIANSEPPELRVYDAAGKFLHRAGRKGWGPGEFQRPAHLQRLAGDTIAVWDAGIGPVSYFDDQLRFIRRERIDGRRLLNLLGAERATEALTPLPDGSFVLHVTLREDEGVPGQVFRPRLGFFRFSRELNQVDSLGWYGGLPQMFLEIGGRRVSSTVLVTTHASAAGGGNPVRIYAGNGDPYEIRAFDANGRLEQLIRRTDPPVPLPADLANRRRETTNDARYAKERARVRAAMPRQTHYPAYNRIHADADGNLWVSKFPSEMDVFDREGRWLGSVDVAGRAVEIGRDYILLLRHDTLGVERVALHDLRRSRTPSNGTVRAKE